ncbi:hypothetical protein PDIG_45800 [Penicillium digitatum PHI26]|uniref:Xylanolytic transcriptional activator regulatory domain-containing protein n=2 Tax=Penicillium digitatum TaxID=36651 RepID=K9FRE5_PEND2|nr:hypothetical protein PDIP_17740 [Penicillium digitatum Pd1]EKV12255.1 hypothetical protein PDIG_45800 [Penicillium digitatum PHI26]EKV20311.1 hypothetical protein PDIP_17740 [Penicillium digitatum Pd1]
MPSPEGSVHVVKKRQKRKLAHSDGSPRRPIPELNGTDSRDFVSTKLYIDSLLVDRQASRISMSAKHPDQLTAIFGPNPNISFFPAKRVRSINERLGHDRLEQLLADIRDIVAAKVKATSSIPRSHGLKEHHLQNAQNFPRERLNAHINIYFEMAIFSSTASAFQFEPLMLSEAAVMAQGLGYNRSNGPHEGTQRRTFWVLYFMEKVSCFITGRGSVLQDSNISCAIPDVQESTFDDYDWGFSFLQYARLVSKIHSSLFTISSVNQPASEYNAKVQGFLTELESWRLSAPLRFRAGEPLKPRLLREPLAQMIALMTNYLYFDALLTLSWTLLHFSAIKLGPMRQLDLKRGLMRTARSVLELTKFIEVAPYTPVWMLAVLPLSCLMILFDLVVHNPDHPEASLSLALLDIASGHFSRLEFASNGSLPGSLVAQFAHLARQYVFEKRECRHKMIDMGARDYSCDIQSAVPAGATAMPPPPAELTTAGLPTSNQPAQTLPGLHEQLPLDPGATRMYDSNLLSENDQLFIPSIDDPSYRLEDLELLGIDLKDLFDYPYAMSGGDTVV